MGISLKNPVLIEKQSLLCYVVTCLFYTEATTFVVVVVVSSDAEKVIYVVVCELPNILYKLFDCFHVNNSTIIY